MLNRQNIFKSPIIESAIGMVAILMILYHLLAVWFPFF